MAGDKSVHEEKPNDKPTPIDYSTLAKLLPSYDGNKRTLAFYIEGVENAIHLIANRNDYIIACLIRNKLSGKAIEALSESPGSRTWEDIKLILQKKFGEFRTEIQLVQELMSVSRDNSSLDAFGDKIRLLMSTLIASEPDRRLYYEQMALETFLDKLNPITAILIKLKHVENLDQAVIVAKQEEIRLRARRNQQKIGTNKPSTSYNKPQKFAQPTKEPFKKKFSSDSSKQFEKKVNYQSNSPNDDDDPSLSDSDQEENPDSEEVQDVNFLDDLLDQVEI